MNTEYTRKNKEKKPVVAICYDFDKTLSPDDMQAQGFIQQVGFFDVKKFWEESNEMAEANDMDQNLAYMYKMVTESVGKFYLTKTILEDYGAGVKLFPGVESWFERIREYGREKGVIVEHYIISSGLREMIEGTKMAKEGAFSEIYASSFYYNQRGVAEWPAQAVNYTNKTQFLFRIEKGVVDVNDPGVNEYFSPDKIRVPFRNIVYIGDSDTDIPCMKLVNSFGGYAIGVYNPNTNDKTKVYKMIRDNRIKLFAPADYTENSELDHIVKTIIDRTVENEALEELGFNAKKEVFEADCLNNGTKDRSEQNDLISYLETSMTFAYTHQIIKKLRKFDDWTTDQIDRLTDILVNNDQVNWIANDPDVSKFYKKLIKNNASNKAVEIVRDNID